MAKVVEIYRPASRVPLAAGHLENFGSLGGSVSSYVMTNELPNRKLRRMKAKFDRAIKLRGDVE